MGSVAIGKSLNHAQVLGSSIRISSGESPVIPTKFMTTAAWLTLALVFMAFFQAIGTITNAIEVHKRRKVAERQLNLDTEKFEYKKLHENNQSGNLEAENDVSRLRDRVRVQLDGH